MHYALPSRGKPDPFLFQISLGGCQSRALPLTRDAPARPQGRSENAAAILPDRSSNGSRSAAGRRAPIRSSSWRKAQAGKSVLLIAPTGAGKTLAGFLPTLTDLARPAEAKAGRSAPRHPHALHFAAEGAGRRHRTQSDEAGQRDGPAVDAWKRAPATRRRTSASARSSRRRTFCSTTPEQLALLIATSGREALLRGSALRRLRRAAFAGDIQARPSAVAGLARLRRYRARPAGDRSVGDRRGAG